MGGMKLKEAQSLAAAVQKRYDASTSRTQKHVDRVNERIQAYGREQEQARQLVVKRMGAFIERHRRQVKENAAQLLDGVSAEQKDIEAFAGALTADIGWIKGAGMAAAAGVGASAGIPAAVTAMGAAGTGTAISSLSGAAAQSATMAWLGGGPLAAGGGGVALGTTALGVVTIGPTMLLGGLTLNVQGDKAMTRAKKHEAQVTVAVEKQKAFHSSLDVLHSRTDEVSGVLGEFVSRALEALTVLESLEFDPEQHATEFQRALSMTFGVRDLCTVPLIGEDGQMNSDTIRLVLKYKEMK